MKEIRYSPFDELYEGYCNYEAAMLAVRLRVRLYGFPVFTGIMVGLKEKANMNTEKHGVRGRR